MKRNIFSLVAIAIAICSVAFTAPAKNKHLTTKLFLYAGADYTQANVAKPSNWSYIGSPGSCSSTNTRACQIEVNTMFVNPDNTLQSTVNIPTAASSPSVYYVTSGGDITSRVNKN